MLNSKVFKFAQLIRIFFLLLIVTSATTSFAQKEFNNWYFGLYAGITFNTVPATALTNGALSISDQTSSISDANGNLLMYSDGLRVWDRNHTIMPNGNGIMGTWTPYSHASIIARMPGSTNLFYIFTLTYFAYPDGLQYAIVDMSLNGGNGDVISKNNMILTPVCEKLAAVKHSNGTDIWIITHQWNSDAFYSYLLSASGLGSPVITHIGSVHTGGGTSGSDNAAGQLAASLDGTKLAIGTYEQSFFGVYDFNNTTGVISNEIVIPNYFRSWGVQFSADGSKLYGSRWTYASIYQFDLLAGSAANIAASAVMVGNTTTPDPGYKAGAMQMGPDEKIYISKMGSPYLAIINDPNVAGAGCNFVDNGIFLGGKISQAGLPIYIQTSYVSPDFTFQDVCIGDSVYFFGQNLSGFSILNWDFGDPSSGANNFSNIENPSHLYNAVGTYNVVLIGQQGSVIDTVQHIITIHAIPVVDLGTDTILCSAADILLSAGNPGCTYVWSTGATSQTINIANSGSYWVTASNGFCAEQDTISVIFGKPVVNLGLDGDLCDNSTVLLDAGSNSLTYDYLWLDGSTEQTLVVSQEGIYSVTISNVCGVVSDSITISKCPDCIVELPSAFSPNDDGVNDIFRVLGSGYTNVHFMIFNRHGEKVFETKDPSIGWDGMFGGVAQEMEVYFYVLQIDCRNSETLIKKGDVTLVR